MASSGRRQQGIPALLLLLLLGLAAFWSAKVGAQDARPVEAAAELLARRQPQAALGLLRPAAEAGDADAQNLLGSCYIYGQGMPVDAAQSYRWFRRAAD